MNFTVGEDWIFYFVSDKVIKDLVGQKRMYWEVEGHEHSSRKNGMMVKINCFNWVKIKAAVMCQKVFYSKSQCEQFVNHSCDLGGVVC